MKRILSFLFLLFVVAILHLNAQKPSLFLFPDFIQGTVMMKNRAKTTALLNYDAANRCMMFKQGNDLLILTNAASVDTIYIENRRFFPVKNHFFLECVPCTHGTVYVNWSLRSKYQGEKGVYGQVSHAINVKNINTSYWTNNSYEKESLDVYEQENDNEYWLKLNGKFVNCKNKKTLMKLFPDHQAEIDEYIKSKKVDFSKTIHVISLLDYSMGLSRDKTLFNIN